MSHTIIAIANQKGGTAKTTTAAVLGTLLSRQGQSAHLIDMDPQASLTSAFGAADATGSLWSALRSGSPLPVRSLGPHLTLTPSSIDLTRAETELLAEVNRERRLSHCLAQTDLSPATTVLIDCPPSLGILAVNCLSAARYVCIVVQPGGFELRALAHLEQSLRVLRTAVNPELTVVGALLANCHFRRKITRHVAAEVATLYPLLGRIRSDARLLAATTAGTLLRLNRSAALDDYGVALNRLVGELP